MHFALLLGQQVTYSYFQNRICFKIRCSFFHRDEGHFTCNVVLLSMSFYLGFFFGGGDPLFFIEFLKCLETRQINVFVQRYNFYQSQSQIYTETRLSSNFQKRKSQKKSKYTPSPTKKEQYSRIFFKKFKNEIDFLFHYLYKIIIKLIRSGTHKRL